MNSGYWRFLGLALFLISLGVYAIYYPPVPLKSKTAPAIKPVATSALPIQKIIVLQGNEFDIILGNNRRIHAYLDVETPPEAKEKVLQIINQGHDPKCVFLSKNSNSWTVDILINTGTIPDKPDSVISLTDWLRRENLIWDLK